MNEFFCRSLVRSAVICLMAAVFPALAAAERQIMISGNENKIELTSGGAKAVAGRAGDSISILDFSIIPPTVTHLPNIENTVLGPPSNVAITPDGSLALIANSIRVDPSNATNFIPRSQIHLLDLTGSTPRLIGEVEAGRQPSGMSITPDGRFALVANRADGTISVLAITGKKVQLHSTVEVSPPADSLSDVAISPDGNTVLATAQKGGYISVLKFSDGDLKPTGQKLSAFGQPYRVVMTPDGELGITAGQGFGNGVDSDAVTIIDLKAEPFQSIDYVTVGSGPESLEISPDGKLLAVVLMNGSNLAPGNPQRTEDGRLDILVRDGKTFRLIQSLKTGAIPEGVAFTSDGKHLVVQCHPARELWIFNVDGNNVSDSAHRIKAPGFPSSLRAWRK